MYIGNDLQIAHPSYKIIDDISSGFNGSQTSFALQVSGATPVPFPISTQQVMISVNGVVQEPDPNGNAGFKLLGSNIVFSSAPANGHAFFGVINAGADYVTAGSEFPDGSATAPSFTFQDDQDTGWFRSGSGAVGFSANGVNTIGFDGNGLTVTGDATFTGDSSKNLLWDKSDGQLEFADNAKAIFGTGSDLELFHNATNSHIRNQTGDLIIDSNSSGSVKLRPKIGEEGVVVITDGAVELFHDGSKKFETTSWGTDVTGKLRADTLQLAGDDQKLQVGASDDLEIYHTSGVNLIQTHGNSNLEIKHGSDVGIKSIANGSVELYYDNSKKFHTHSTGVTVTGYLHIEDGSTGIGLGNSDDLKLFHDGSNSYITHDGTGNLIAKTTGADEDFYLQSGNDIYLQPQTNEEGIKVIGNGAVELYHDNSKKLETTSAGITVTGEVNATGNLLLNTADNQKIFFGAGNDLQIFHDGSNNYINSTITNGDLILDSAQNFYIKHSGEKWIEATNDAGVKLYYDNIQRIETTSSGINVTGAINVNGAALSSAPTITATANGSITANEAIIVESDGKVAGITGVSASLGTEQEYYNGRVRQHMCAFDSTTGKSVHVYANDGNQNQLYARVGTISGTGISYGSVVAVSNTGDSDLTFEYGCSMACGNGKVVIVLADSSGGGDIKARAGTISGTSISFGSAIQLQNGPTNSSTGICYDSDKDKFVVLLSNNDTGNQCESQILTVSGNSLSEVDGGRVVSNSGDDACFINVVYVPEKTAYFAVYCNSTGEDPRTGHAGAGLAKGVVGTINGAGNQLTWGSASTLGSDNKNNLSIAYVPSIEKVAMVYLDRYSQYRLESLVVAVDWTNKTMSIGNYSVIESSGNSDYQPIVACLNDSEPKIVVAYKHSPGLVNNIGTITTSNNTISYAGRQTIDSGGDIRVGSAWGKVVYPKIASGKFMLSAVDYSANKTWSLIQQFAATDLTTQNFIGFASAGYSNGNTATINIAGNTTTQSSLTPGKKYYVQQDGSLALTADTPSVVAGTALTSTSLLINPGR